MKAENRNSVERLSLLCHLTGLFSVFVGLSVSIMDMFKGDMTHLSVGVYIFATGYALVKISTKLSQILILEQ